MQGNEAVSHHEAFLQLPGTTWSEWHLHSQVAIFDILNRAYQQFGNNNKETALSEALITTLHTWNAELDNWRSKWDTQISMSPFDSVQISPDIEVLVSHSDEAAKLSREVLMYWNFAKLLINSLGLRGLPPQQAHLIPNQRRDFANLAITYALNTFNFILEDNPSRKSISGDELYLHTMIMYSSVFLLRVHTRWQPARLNLNIGQALSLMERVARLLDQAKTSQRHHVSSISICLAEISAKF
jgi:hypothetical protein